MANKFPSIFHNIIFESLEHTLGRRIFFSEQSETGNFYTFVREKNGRDVLIIYTVHYSLSSGVLTYIFLLRLSLFCLITLFLSIFVPKQGRNRWGLFYGNNFCELFARSCQNRNKHVAQLGHIPMVLSRKRGQIQQKTRFSSLRCYKVFYASTVHS